MNKLPQWYYNTLKIIKSWLITERKSLKSLLTNNDNRNDGTSIRTVKKIQSTSGVTISKVGWLNITCLLVCWLVVLHLGIRWSDILLIIKILPSTVTSCADAHSDAYGNQQRECGLHWKIVFKKCVNGSIDFLIKIFVISLKGKYVKS